MWSHALSNLQKKDILTVIYIFPLQIPVCHILCVRKYQSSHGNIGGSSREKMSQGDLILTQGNICVFCSLFCMQLSFGQLSQCGSDFQGHSHHCLYYNSHCDPNLQGKKVVSQFKCVLCNFTSVWEVGEKSDLKCQEPDSVVEHSSKPHACRIISARLNFTPALSK